MQAPRWKIITPSQYEWEREGLDFIRAGLPDHDPYCAWSNFEFQTNDGTIYEVDLLVLTKQGFWLVECKAWGGCIRGDASAWTRSQDGRITSEDNPVLLANRKAKALASLLGGKCKLRLPWLDALVFLSADNLQCELSGIARNRVLLRDRAKSGDRPEEKGILAALIRREGPGIDPEQRGYIDKKTATALSRAMEEAGIRPSQRSRRIGDYLLGDLIFDGPGYQDRLAKHTSMKDHFCRVRQYSVAHAASEDERKRLKRAATREFQIIRSLEHPNILPVLDYKDHENGPALFFRYSDPQGVRLDHFLNTSISSLGVGQRIDLLRQLADAIRYAHSKRIIHRSLGPQSVLVTEADSPSPRLQIFNWQVGVWDNTTTSGRLTKVDDLVESQSLVYMSPEALSDSRKVSEASDVFSLGAIAFHLFASRPPATNPTELAQILRENRGLSLSAAVDGIGRQLEELVRYSTHPDVMSRYSSAKDFLDQLDMVEDELTAPEEMPVVDPLVAKQGDILEHGFVVKRELGKGATAKALLVVKGDKEHVLKVALNDENNARLLDEAKALRAIHSEFIISIAQELTMGGRTVLVLEKAGDRTLSEVLTKEGVPSLDLLERYGDDLLSAVASLERNGVWHRDIKPDNIGIRSLGKSRNQLILFDFSLANAPLGNILVGTEGYRDPFLSMRKPPQWDLAAERYSAAVTLYEMTLGHGVLPQWGKDKSDPSLTDDALVLDAERFDAGVRDGMTAFFSQAFHREPAERFDNAIEMQNAWRQLFKDAEQRKITTISGEEITIGVSLTEAQLTTPVSALGLSTRARNALERANIITVRNLLSYPVSEIYVMRGVGNQTRQEIIRFVGELRGKFPEFEATKLKEQTVVDENAGPPNLEALHHGIVGMQSPKKTAEWNIRAALLGVTAPDAQPVTHWPSQTEVGEAMHVTRARVGQIVSADRNRWSKDPQLTAFRHELCEQIQRLGGLATIADLIELTILIRPAANTLEPLLQQRLASAVARAAVETEETMAQRRFQLRRINSKTVVACSQELVGFAEQVGKIADQLAEADPLASPLRVIQELCEIPLPPQPLGCQPFSSERLLQLAAAMSQNAAVSPRQEIYPRGMTAERAMRLGVGALSGLGLSEAESGLSVFQVRERVSNRYPQAELLPDRPELDALLKKVGLDVHWDAEANVYRRKTGPFQQTSGTSMPDRLATSLSPRRTEVTPEVADARAFEDRMQHAQHEGGFLILTVRPSRMRFAAAELVRRFKVKEISFDSLLFDALREEAQRLGIDWTIVGKADGADRSSQDWKNLMQLVGRVAPTITNQLLTTSDHLLLTNPGLIARYDQMPILEALRDHVGHAGNICPGIWLLVAADGQSDLPVMDGSEIPVITPGQRVSVVDSWIDNRHRGESNNAPLSATSARHEAAKP